MRPTLELVDKTLDFKRDDGKAYLVPGSRRMICRDRFKEELQNKTSWM